MLRKVVSLNEGTANFADIEGYEVAGKTGTALKYNSKAKLNTFVSLFPASRPKHVLLVMLDEPKPDEAKMHADDLAGTCGTCPGVSTNNSIHGVGVAKTGHAEWLLLFGDSPLGSTYQDGHFVYQVVAGGGTGNGTYPPTLYVTHVENASHFNNVLEP